MAVTKTIAYAGDATATWLISGDFTGDYNAIQLFPADFDQLPAGRLKDILTAEYTSDVVIVDYETGVLAANQKLTKFSEAWAAAGGSVSTAIGTPDFAPVPTGTYSAATGSFAVSPAEATRVRFLGMTDPFFGPHSIGQLVIKFSLNYSAGR